MGYFWGDVLDVDPHSLSHASGELELQGLSLTLPSSDLHGPCPFFVSCALAACFIFACGYVHHIAEVESRQRASPALPGATNGFLLIRSSAEEISPSFAPAASFMRALPRLCAVEQRLTA